VGFLAPDTAFLPGDCYSAPPPPPHNYPAPLAAQNLARPYPHYSLPPCICFHCLYPPLPSPLPATPRPPATTPPQDFLLGIPNMNTYFRQVAWFAIHCLPTRPPLGFPHPTHFLDRMQLLPCKQFLSLQAVSKPHLSQPGAYRATPHCPAPPSTHPSLHTFAPSHTPHLLLDPSLPSHLPTHMPGLPSLHNTRFTARFHALHFRLPLHAQGWLRFATAAPPLHHATHLARVDYDTNAISPRAGEHHPAAPNIFPPRAGAFAAPRSKHFAARQI